LIEGPGDAEFRIVPEDRTFAGRIVAACCFVEDLGGLGENEETMGKAFGNPEELELAVVIAGLEIECGPATEVGRVAAEIDGDVPDVAGEDADEFALWMAELVVEAAEDTARRKRLIVLGEGGGKTERGKGVCIENFGEPTACVAIALGLQDFYIAQGGIT
jgi:hypothetical protein